MAPRRLCLAVISAAAVALVAPSGAEARTPCPGEDVPPSLATAVQTADAIFCLTNQVRAHYGLPAFRRDLRLDLSSRLHSQDMADRGYFSHTGLDGSNPSERAKAQGYTGGAGENIAAGHRDARAVVTGWMSSAGHCQNILSAAKDSGVGIGLGGSYGVQYTQTFGDYFSRSLSEAAADACPYDIDLDELDVPGTAGQPGPTVAGTTPDAPAAPRATGRLRLSGLKLSSKRVRSGKATTLTYKLSSGARVAIKFEKRKPGRRVRWSTLSAGMEAIGNAGSNEVRIPGKLNGRKLAKGQYRIRATATDSSGRQSTVQRLAFTVVSK